MLERERVVEGAVEVDGAGILIVGFLEEFCGLRIVRARSAAFFKSTPRFLAGKVGMDN